MIITLDLTNKKILVGDDPLNYELVETQGINGNTVINIRNKATGEVSIIQIVKDTFWTFEKFQQFTTTE